MFMKALSNNICKMLSILDALLQSMVANEGGHDSCDTTPGFSRKLRPRPIAAATPCDPGFVLDAVNGMCYMIPQTIGSFESGEKFCSNFDSDVVQFENDAMVKEFINMLTTGELI